MLPHRGDDDMLARDGVETEMAKARSPEYPAIGLGEAIDKVRRVYARDYQNRIPREVLASHMGYRSLSGASLPIISALAKYGLIEGRGNDTRVSDLAVSIIAHEPRTPEWARALREAAEKPELFAELDQRSSGGKTGDAAIRSYLLTQKFIPSAADAAIRAYRETKELVGGVSIEHNRDALAQDKSPQHTPEVGDLIQVDIGGARQLPKPARVRAVQEHEGRRWMFIEGSETGIPVEQTILERKGHVDATPPRLAEDIPQPGTRREVFALDEGDVTLTFPENLSRASFHDLEGYLNLFLRKAQRRAGAGDFFAEVYSPDGLKAKEVRYFDEFAALCQFIQSFKEKNSNDILRAHLPARATEDQRRAILETGAQFA
jgi:hypothetical protein